MRAYIKGKTVVAFLEALEELRDYVKTNYGEKVYNNLRVSYAGCGVASRITLLDVNGVEISRNKLTPVEVLVE